LYPLSEEIVQGIVVYDAQSLIPQLRGSDMDHNAVMEELQRALLAGPGVYVIRNLMSPEVIDKADGVAEYFNPKADWKGMKLSRRTFSFCERHAKHDPESFADYYGNDVL
jgi:hypothetical protein